MRKEIESGVDFEMSELLRKEKQMIRDKYLTKANDGYEFFDVAKMTSSDLKLHESHRPFKHNGDNRTGLQVINDRRNLQNEYKYLRGK